MTNLETAEELFKSGYNCSQTVFMLFAPKYGLSKEMAVKIACGFGGGMRDAQVCGAVTGALMVIGLKYGNENNATAQDQESKQLCYQKTKEFIKLFRETQGSIVCKELLGIDISTEEGNKAASEQGLFQTTCVDMVVKAVEILEQEGY